ncbi:rapid alkalinization factor-like [Amaranthus tricolor]|uniref:rapid alkalinization factor-like n=1 Tax=Amaranthus tricolor TaxID=29722 RepID=UPI002585A844|nr:rapid alkalinization factor-like [Amaranthus tricolor]
MGNPKCLLLILALGLFALGMLTVDAKDVKSLSKLTLTRPVCSGSMAECLAGDELDELEFMFDSDTNRRILKSQSNYISYGALNKNRVPCSRRGASYYNCKPGAQANPYTRGCSNISRCRRG